LQGVYEAQDRQPQEWKFMVSMNDIIELNKPQEFLYLYSSSHPCGPEYVFAFLRLRFQDKNVNKIHCSGRGRLKADSKSGISHSNFILLLTISNAMSGFAVYFFNPTVLN
jgi:hypothetical protein